MRPSLLLPIPLGDRGWRLVGRARLPMWLALQDEQGRVLSGLEDATTTLGLVTPRLGWFDVGVGPFVRWPTATDDAFGRRGWGPGGAVAIVASPGPVLIWAVGTCARMLTSHETIATVEWAGHWHSQGGWALGLSGEAFIEVAGQIDAELRVGPAITRLISTRSLEMQIELAFHGWPLRERDTPTGTIELAVRFFIPQASGPLPGG